MNLISNKQLSVSVTLIIISVVLSFWLVKLFFDYLELPEVWMSQDTCVKVVNYKNGDGYGCQDKDVILRKYVVVHVK